MANIEGAYEDRGDDIELRFKLQLTRTELAELLFALLRTPGGTGLPEFEMLLLSALRSGARPVQKSGVYRPLLPRELAEARCARHRRR